MDGERLTCVRTIDVCMCIIEALIDGLDDSRYAERDELVVEEVDNVCCYCFMPLQKNYEVRCRDSL